MKKRVNLILAVVLLLASMGMAQAQTQLEQDLAEMRAWMQQRSAQADSAITAEWPTVKKEFEELSYSLDRNTKKLSEKSRVEYETYKQRYTEWKVRNESQLVDLDGKELERWEREMTGTTQISKIKPVHLRDAFNKALEYTREYRRDWTLRDWDYAEFVLGELNTRKTNTLDLLSTGDKIKIAALQVEFATLKKGREAKDAYEEMRESR
ncbi:hypothetical protein [Pontibacter oryzae]|uniref:DUF3450 family protein n=1 Tax=Pontibacter oryzae TaxID=2304593 RepID=A0A399SFE5_9BACT|nr:hypothetical protein [Pontibacter oryzae]RIJ42856.1 hypothetical protein D1627_03130 [Pontibacter oryzae]